MVEDADVPEETAATKPRPEYFENPSAVGDTAAAVVKNPPKSRPLVKVKMTYDKEVLLHEITDDQLRQLEEPRRDLWLELFWGFAGLALGSLVPAIQSGWTMWTAPQTVAVLDFVPVVSLAVFAILAAIAAGVYLKRNGKITNLAGQIRNRPTRPVERT